MHNSLKVLMMLVGIGALSACGGASGGGGGGGAVASGGAAGTACSGATVNEGCLTTSPPKRMQCVSGKWAEIATCGANEHCNETADPTAPGTTKRLTVCVANVVVGTDASSGSDASDASTTSDVSDTASSDAVISVDVIGGEDGTTVKPDTGKDACVPKCTGKTCGPDGCGGNCGTCGGDQTCNATGNCVTSSGGTIALGLSCFGKTSGCVAGSLCQANANLSDWVCQKARNAGQSCGPGIGDCAAGSTCNFVDNNLKSMKCYAMAGDGAACSVPGSGDCASGETCVYTDAQGSATQCVPAVGPGGSCDVIGLGLCGPANDCIAQSGGGSYQCMAEAEIGSPCGAGVGGCVKGSDCVYDSSAKSSATCQAWGQAGDECGNYGTAGSCVIWSSCTPDSSDTGSTFHCQPFAAAGGECGYNIGLCAPFLQCGFADSSQTTLTCLKAGGAGDMCGAGVGGCLPGYQCFLAAQGDPTGTCKDECTTSNLYNNGTCDSCLKVDPDCLK
jgi:hypothetical protein